MPRMVSRSTRFFVLVSLLAFLAAGGGLHAQTGSVDLLNVPAAGAGPAAAGGYDPAAAARFESGYGRYAASARGYSYDQAINVLVIGDGYTQAESARFSSASRRAIQAVYASPEFQRANGYSRVRFWPYFVVSGQSGASSARKGSVRTALGATYADRYGGDTSIYADFQKVWSVARSIQGISFNYVLVLVNCRQYAATHWSTGICVISDFDRLIGVSNPVTFEDIICHEFLGHTIGGLWDEYVYGNVPSQDLGSSPNCDVNGQYPKWADLLGWQPSGWTSVAVGAYQGCAHASLYRPTYVNCKMNSWANQPFCPVCSRRILSVLQGYGY